MNLLFNKPLFFGATGVTMLQVTDEVIGADKASLILKVLVAVISLIPSIKEIFKRKK